MPQFLVANYFSNMRFASTLSYDYLHDLDLMLLKLLSEVVGATAVLRSP